MFMPICVFTETHFDVCEFNFIGYKLDIPRKRHVLTGKLNLSRTSPKILRAVCRGCTATHGF